MSGAIKWNDLHPQLRTITCLTSFKRELRKTVCSHITVQACLYEIIILCNVFICVKFVQFDSIVLCFVSYMFVT